MHLCRDCKTPARYRTMSRLQEKLGGSSFEDVMPTKRLSAADGGGVEYRHQFPQLITSTSPHREYVFPVTRHCQCRLEFGERPLPRLRLARLGEVAASVYCVSEGEGYLMDDRSNHSGLNSARRKSSLTQDIGCSITWSGLPPTVFLKGGEGETHCSRCKRGRWATS